MDKPEPTEQELKLAKMRLRNLDALDRHCNWDSANPTYEQLQARERWHRIMKEQSDFEAKYF